MSDGLKMSNSYLHAQSSAFRAYSREFDSYAFFAGCMALFLLYSLFTIWKYSFSCVGPLGLYISCTLNIYILRHWLSSWEGCGDKCRMANAPTTQFMLAWRTRKCKKLLLVYHCVISHPILQPVNSMLVFFFSPEETRLLFYAFRTGTVQMFDNKCSPRR